MKQSLRVAILGQQFNLLSDATPEQVQRIADFVEGQIHQVTASGKVVDSLHAAVLALLNVSALYLENGKGERSTVEDERLRMLVGRIERALDGP